MGYYNVEHPDYYEPPEEDFKYCKQRRDIQDWMEGILDQLYGEEPFNEARLEDYIDELTGLLDMEMPTGGLKIEAKK